MKWIRSSVYINLQISKRRPFLVFAHLIRFWSDQSPKVDRTNWFSPDQAFSFELAQSDVDIFMEGAARKPLSRPRTDLAQCCRSPKLFEDGENLGLAHYPCSKSGRA